MGVVVAALLAVATLAVIATPASASHSTTADWSIIEEAEGSGWSYSGSNVPASCGVDSSSSSVHHANFTVRHNGTGTAACKATVTITLPYAGSVALWAWIPQNSSWPMAYRVDGGAQVDYTRTQGGSAENCSPAAGTGVRACKHFEAVGVSAGTHTIEIWQRSNCTGTGCSTAYWHDFAEATGANPVCDENLLELFGGPPVELDLIRGQKYRFYGDFNVPTGTATVTSLTFHLHDDAIVTDSVTVTAPDLSQRVYFDVYPTSGGPMGPDEEYEVGEGVTHAKISQIDCAGSDGSGVTWFYGGEYYNPNDEADQSYGEQLSQCITTAGIGFNPSSWVPALVKGTGCVLRVMFVPSELGENGRVTESMSDLADEAESGLIFDVLAPVQLLFGMAAELGDLESNVCDGPDFEFPIPASNETITVYPLRACGEPWSQYASWTKNLLSIGVYISSAIAIYRMVSSAVFGEAVVYQQMWND